MSVLEACGLIREILEKGIFHTGECCGNIKCVKRSSLNAGERWGCYLKLLQWLGVSLNWGRLIEDICVATVPASKAGFLNLRSLLN